MSEYTTRAEYDERQREIDHIAEELHQQYLLTAGRLGWPVKPECQVPYAQLSEEAKELDRVFARWHLAKVDTLAAESATVKARLIESEKAAYDVNHTIEYVKQQRDHWKAEAATQVDAKMQFAAAVDNLRDERTALQRELATVKAERDDWKRKYERVRNDPDYATCCQQRWRWKAEAVWAARGLSMLVEAKGGLALDSQTYQRAQAVLKEAGGE